MKSFTQGIFDILEKLNVKKYDSFDAYLIKDSERLNKEHSY